MSYCFEIATDRRDSVGIFYSAGMVGWSHLLSCMRRHNSQSNLCLSQQLIILGLTVAMRQSTSEVRAVHKYVGTVIFATSNSACVIVVYDMFVYQTLETKCA